MSRGAQAHCRWVMWVALIAAARTPSAAAQVERGWTLVVEPDPRACMSDSSLRERVEHWLRDGRAGEGIVVRVRPGARPLAFSVARGGRVLAERTFEVLPSRCRDRI